MALQYLRRVTCGGEIGRYVIFKLCNKTNLLVSQGMNLLPGIVWRNQYPSKSSQINSPLNKVYHMNSNQKLQIKCHLKFLPLEPAEDGDPDDLTRADKDDSGLRG